MTRSVEDMTSFGATVRHACAVAVSDEHLWELSSTFMMAGFAAGEQVNYFDDGTSHHVLERLLDDGADLERLLGTGQLVVVPTDTTRATLASPLDQVSDVIDQAIDTALESGYSGIRMTGQLNHGLARNNGVSVREFDEHLDQVIEGRPARALCLYDRAHYPDDVIEHMRAVHRVEIESSTIYDDNLLRITTSCPGTARLAGEVDHSNRPQVRKLLLGELDRALRSPSSPHEIRLDVSSLRFTDVAGAVAVVHAAEEFPSSHKLVLEGVRPRVARVLDRCGAPFAAQLVMISRPDHVVPPLRVEVDA
ncbi:MEDS domain-containing protein [Pseudonocardia sp. CA-107938]|uniref:MEDS domain-containing protein n=1 Tax=Pseudonocardia sp. CA-107938 TaxID=3240021 RepID=UPI003D9090CA